MEQQAIDPVCGMTIATACAERRDHEGRTYYLCSDRCAAKFDADAPAYSTVARLNLDGWGRTQTPGFIDPKPCGDFE